MGTTPILNLPFVDPTDLVRDFPGDDEAQMLAVEAAIEAAGNAGIGSNVVQTVKTDTFTTTATSPTDVTGLAVTLTPSSATSKVLVLAQVAISGLSGDGANFFMRISGGNATSFVGDADGSRTRALALGHRFAGEFESQPHIFTLPAMLLDNPETASAVTYTVQVWTPAGTNMHVNRSVNDADQVRRGRVASSITAIEVAV